MTVIERLEAIAAQRRIVKETREEIEAARAEWQERNKDRIEAGAAATQALAEMESSLRADLAEAFTADEFDDKHPYPGVEIRIMREVVYETEKARAWAIDNMRAALKLDQVAFEKFAKASPEAVAAVAIIEQVPRVTLATDLGGALRAARAEVA